MRLATLLVVATTVLAVSAAASAARPGFVFPGSCCYYWGWQSERTGAPEHDVPESKRMRIEVLTFTSCPNAQAVRELVERIVAESRVDAEVEYTVVHDAEAATQRRFLGSPTVRVDGRDIEPGAAERTEYVLACRIYRTREGLAGVPEEGWLRDALAASRR